MTMINDNDAKNFDILAINLHHLSSVLDCFYIIILTVQQNYFYTLQNYFSDTSMKSSFRVQFQIL